MEAEGTRFRTGVDVGVDITGQQLRDALRRGRARHRRDRRRATCRSRAASSTASTRRWSTCRRPTGSRWASSVDGPDHRRRASTSSSSAAATPAPTASAPRTARARASVTQLEIMPRPADERPGRPAVADVPDDLPRLLAPTRRAASGSTPSSTERVPRRRRRQRARAARWSRSRSSTAGFEPRSRAPSARSRPSWCCSRWASPARRRPGCVEQLGVELDERGNVARDDDYMTRVAGRLRRRRRRPRPVADRLGDRRGPRRRRRASTPTSPGRPTLPRPITPTDRAARRLTGAGPPARSDVGRRHASSVAPLRLGSRMRRAKIVCTLGPATSSAGADPRARRRRHGRRPAQPQPRRLRRPRAASTATCAQAADDDRPRRRHPRRPAGPEDPARPVRRRPGHARRRATRSPSPPTTSPGDATRSADDVQGPARRRHAGDPLLIDDGKVAPRGRSRSTAPTCVTEVVVGGTVSQQQGHQPARRRGQRARAVREGRATTCAGRCACGVDIIALSLRAQRRRHRATCTRSWTRRAVRAAGHRQDREAAGGRQPRRDHRRLRRHHGRPRRPRRGAAARGRAARAEARHRAGPPQRQAGHRRDPDARVDDRELRARPAPRPPTSPTPCSTAPTR